MIRMSRMKTFLIILFLSIVLDVSGQQVLLLTSGEKTSLRGLSVLNDKVIWASGSNGKVARSLDGGLHWEWITVIGQDKSDFRDIHAFSDKEAVILKVGEPALLLRTTDGGKSWKTVYADSTKGVFLDALAFRGRYGQVIGDPIPNEPYVYTLQTSNKGKKWEKLLSPNSKSPRLDEGEAFFASSGTNLAIVQTIGKKRLTLLATGGKVSSLIRSDSNSKKRLPLLQGSESTGANSIAAWDPDHLIVCGGNFLSDRDTTANCYLSNDGGQNWIRPARPPFGYRSCVIYISRDTLLACGTSGVDISFDGGMNWTLISAESFHVCQSAQQGKAVFLAGSTGRIAKLEGLIYEN